jgi:hypothetical protein
MVWSFWVEKNHKIAKSSTTSDAREKISTDLKSSDFYKYFDRRMTNFKNNQTLHNKIIPHISSYLVGETYPYECTFAH